MKCSETPDWNIPQVTKINYQIDALERDILKSLVVFLSV